MVFFLKSASSRRVSNNTEEHVISRSQEDYSCSSNVKKDDGDDEKKNVGPCTMLTVWRKSLLVSCSGFTVIDCKGDLLYRVDNYCGRPTEIVLMDGSGKSVLTMRRHKTLRLVDDWVVYDGEPSDVNNKICHKKQPIGYMKKNVSFLQGPSNILAHVFLGTSRNKRPTYVIEGSYGQRYCKVFDKSSKKIVAEVKKKEAMNGSASFGLDVFRLVVAPGFDTGFAMALVLSLDQMYI